MCPLCGEDKAAFFCERIGPGQHDDPIRRNYYKCPVCSMVFLSPDQRLSSWAQKQRYDEHQNDPEDRRYLDFLARLAEPLRTRLNPGARGLDFGCGPGPAMGRWFRMNGFRVDEYDPIYRPQKALLTKTYDFVTCSETAEHFYDPRGEFLLLDRLLKFGAFLGVMTCMLEDDIRFDDWWYPRDPTHVCFYSAKTFHWIASWLHWEFEAVSPTVVIFQKPIRL
jgi:hypothetical protein